MGDGSPQGLSCRGSGRMLATAMRAAAGGTWIFQEGWRMKRGHLAKAMGWVLIGAFWLAVFALIAAVGGELWLRARTAEKEREKETPYSRLCAKYDPFSIQHLHPNYLFFFPLRWKDQEALNNEVCRLVPGGFRGWGPEERGDRKLAFVIGGSSAFGAKASSDRTTLAGYLNQIQNEYLFVNAGVPSWVTAQSLARLVNQIMPLDPKLIISFEMANDAAIMRRHAESGLDLPPGTPESFSTLAALVDNIRAGRRPPTEPFFTRTFPNLKALIDKRVFGIKRKKKKGDSASPVPDELIKLHAAKYLTNLEIMRDLCRARGARFLGVIQPISYLHKTAEVGPGDRKVLATRDFFSRFRASVLGQAPADLPLLDLGSFFDRHFDKLPIRKDEPELTPDLVLADRVHLTDRGNEMVAREIWRELQERQAKP